MNGPTLDDLLDRADVARSAGEGATAGARYAAAIDLARDEGDLARWTRAALGAASVHLFGTEPGRLPAELYEVLVRTVDDADRARVSAALARVWSYSGYPERGAPFAAEALERAERTGDAELLSDCLDAALTVHWGPDELDQRVALTARLAEVAAHVLDPVARLQATMWSLEVACQALDVPAMYRHLRRLEKLGEESPRARFFAASRRLMLDLLRGRSDTVATLVGMAEEASHEAGLADSFMVLEAMKGFAALVTGDVAACAASAAQATEFARLEGSAVVSAEAATLWVGAGQPGPAVDALNGFYGEVLDHLPRDTNWLLTVHLVLTAAAATDQDELVDCAGRLLAPYEGRAVFNTGALAFHGVTDHSLAIAADRRSDAQEARRLRDRAHATYTRLGATWWRARLLRDLPDRATSPASWCLHPAPGGGWLVGSPQAPATLPALRGLSYLRALVRSPGREISAVDLATGAATTAIQGDLGPAVDRAALLAYRQRLDELDDAIADTGSDAHRLEALQDERDAILAEVRSATGLGGRARTTGSTRERARVAVTKAIGTALQRITEAAPAAGAHLGAAVHTGATCRYQPDEEICWILDA
jgi:hypothetical protein